MTRTNSSGASAEPLSFPNPSRSYDETRHGVLFWGYDRTIEVSFLIEETALVKITPDTREDETGFLNSFDVNRDRICAVAEHVYSRRRRASYFFAYTLTNTDF